MARGGLHLFIRQCRRLGLVYRSFLIMWIGFGFKGFLILEVYVLGQNELNLT